MPSARHVGANVTAIEVARFELDLEANLLALQRELREGSYRPGGYRLFEIYDRKPRRIAAAPFRDRVVHHALMNRVEPALDRTFIRDSYACRVGKGVHAAVNRYQEWCRRYDYVLKIDVRKYFPSIDHTILKAKLRRRLKEPEVLRLFELIIDSAPDIGGAPQAFPGDDLVDLMHRRCGLPIGNLTSQFLGNLYLDDLDHFIKETCRVRPYLRYVDDLVLLADEKPGLWTCMRRLKNSSRASGCRCTLKRCRFSLRRMASNCLAIGCFPIIGGYAVITAIASGAGCGLRRLNMRPGSIGLSEVRASVNAWIGHIRHADSVRIRKAVLNSVSFRRAADQALRPARGSRRRLEQQTGERPVGQP